MAQITSLMVAVIMAITPVTQAGAWDCTPGLLYCGDTLVRNGYDVAKITEAAKAANVNELYYYQALFTCNADGGITYEEACLFECVDGGRGENGSCNL
ncbi:hypothetical protein E4U09_001434 [Claviceps aff. purpurea]|uniref:Uncharacterized protein n=1 Tax=Claviceps aff. purpurea TaxID=1967640 RepID=A0A9P7QJH9_9HYPO|nr:hypothetical protein E4U09_001434 [Claviceps aff. purpurea]